MFSEAFENSGKLRYVRAHTHTYTYTHTHTHTQTHTLALPYPYLAIDASVRAWECMVIVTYPTAARAAPGALGASSSCAALPGLPTSKERGGGWGGEITSITCKIQMLVQAAPVDNAIKGLCI